MSVEISEQVINLTVTACSESARAHLACKISHTMILSVHEIDVS